MCTFLVVISFKFNAKKSYEMNFKFCIKFFGVKFKFEWYFICLIH